MSEMGAMDDTTPLPGQTGNSGYRFRVLRKAKIRQSLIDDYCFDKPTHAVMLEIIVEALDAAKHARSHNDRVRSANTARRLLAQVPKRDALLGAL
jgi:hypothetical protein